MANASPQWEKTDSTSLAATATASIWAVRICFTVVFFLNVMCAIQFIVAPADFAPAYQLEGLPGEVATAGIGITFLLWNTTYPAFIVAPRKFPVLGWIILIQQAIGVCGETCIYLGLPVIGYEVLSASLLRFIAFDAGGFIFMALSFAWFLWAFHRH